MAGFESASLRWIEQSNRTLLDQVRDRLGVGDLTPEALRAKAAGPALESLGGRSGARPESMAYRAAPTEAPLGQPQLEAIILAIVRPPLLVQGGTYVPPVNPVPEVAKIINDFKRAKIDPVIAMTGRVDLLNVPRLPYVGTAWIVEKPSPTKAILVTNRHVAEEFADPDGGGSYFFRTLPNFDNYRSRIDFIQEHGSMKNLRAPVARVVFMAGSNAPDIALIEVEGDALKDLSVIDLSTATLKKGGPIAVVGYPAYDSRSDPDDVAAYFGNIFDVKRFSFGEITGVDEERAQFTHDATTLGGNSGSCVFDRETGQPIGLHFAGDYKVANYAVLAREIQAALRGLKSQVVVASVAATEARGDGRHKASYFKGRDGYAADFLGEALMPPSPGPQWQGDLADAIDPDEGGTTNELKYRHFSVWMSKSRKLPLMTAVNIDGSQSKRMGRIAKWFIDERLDVDLQVDNAAYARNPLDRGHMVRREDPVWGELELAGEANEDTFHYTNCAPQHEDLNQRDWVGLEDYILGNARTRGLQVSVFTGPILRDNDREYRDLVKLPTAFWKIAAVINDETGKLSVTGYVLAQGDLIKDLTNEFVYGAYATYQVEVSRIGELARLDVSHLAKHDPFALQRQQEGLAMNRGSFRSVNGPADLVI
jgi:endonuclease G, mitochondrial